MALTRICVRRPLDGELAGQRDHGALRGGVAGGAHRLRSGPDQAGDRGGVQDHAAPLADHLARGGLGDHEEAGRVRLDHLPETLDRHRLGRRAPGDAGVVDEDIETAVALRDLVDERFDRRRVGHVAARGADVEAGGAQLGLGRLQPLGTSAGDRHRRAGLGQPLGDLSAQPARAAGDERHPAGQVEERSDVGHGASKLVGCWVLGAGEMPGCGDRLPASSLRLIRDVAAHSPAPGTRHPAPGTRVVTGRGRRRRSAARPCRPGSRRRCRPPVAGRPAAPRA